MAELWPFKVCHVSCSSVSCIRDQRVRSTYYVPWLQTSNALRSVWLCCDDLVEWVFCGCRVVMGDLVLIPRVSSFGRRHDDGYELGVSQKTVGSLRYKVAAKIVGGLLEKRVGRFFRQMGRICFNHVAGKEVHVPEKKLAYDSLKNHSQVLCQHLLRSQKKLQTRSG